jgi:hypothetical protein
MDVFRYILWYSKVGKKKRRVTDGQAMLVSLLVSKSGAAWAELFFATEVRTGQQTG